MQENQAPWACEVRQRENRAAKHSRMWGAVTPLGEWPRHHSNLEQEQAEWRRAASLLQEKPGQKKRVPSIHGRSVSSGRRAARQAQVGTDGGSAQLGE